MTDDSELEGDVASWAVTSAPEGGRLARIPGWQCHGGAHGVQGNLASNPAWPVNSHLANRAQLSLARRSLPNLPAPAAIDCMGVASTCMFMLRTAISLAEMRSRPPGGAALAKAVSLSQSYVGTVDHCRTIAGLRSTNKVGRIHQAFRAVHARACVDDP